MPYFARGKNKVQNPFNFSEIYDLFVDEMQESCYKVDGAAFMKACDSFYKEAVNKVLQGKRFALPFGMGVIKIGKKKATRFGGIRFIDWKTTLEIGKKVYHLNEHTQGYNYYIIWTKPNKIKNQHMYRFIPTRDFRRTLAKIIKNKEVDYFEIEGNNYDI